MDNQLATIRGPELRDRLHTARASAVAVLAQTMSADLKVRIAAIDSEFTTAIRTAVAAYEGLVATPAVAPEPVPTPEPEPSTRLDAGLTIADPRSPPPRPPEPLATVIAAARLVDARLKSPLLLYGRPAMERAEKAMAWRHRSQELMAMTVRLQVLDDATNARHPSLFEGLQLRDRISTAAVEATVQAKANADP